MTTQEAKFLLSAYRPDGRDAADPFFAEALAQARSDPELAAWFAREQAMDARISERLGGIVPPQALRESILAGARGASVTLMSSGPAAGVSAGGAGGRGGVTGAGCRVQFHSPWNRWRVKALVSRSRICSSLTVVPVG